MAYAFKPFEKVVGSFVVITVATLVIVALVLARNKGLFTENTINYFTYYTKADAVAGGGMKILYNGFTIGKTVNVELMDDDRVKVYFYIEKKFANRVRMDSVAHLNEGIIPGSTTITITRGRDSSELCTGGRLYSSDEEEGRRLVKEIHGRVFPPNGLDKTVLFLTDLIKFFTKEDGPIMKLLVLLEGILKQDPGSPIGLVKDLLRDVNKIMSLSKDENTSVGALLSDKKVIYNRLISIMRTTEDVMQNSSVLTRNLSQMGLLGGTKDRDTRGVTIEQNQRSDGYSNR